VKRWVSGAGTDFYINPATYFNYDGWDLLQEGSNAWGPSRVYVQGNRVDEIVWSNNTSTGEQAFHHYDARGHCTLLSDSSANILEQYEYDAFGQPYFYDASGNSIGSSDLFHQWQGYSQFGNRFLFTGREWLPDVRLYDYRNRMYQPELGRFLQPDPKEFGAGDYNLYRYCHNDPVNRTDPFGLDSLNLYNPYNHDPTKPEWEAANVRGLTAGEITVGGHGSNRTIVDWRSGQRVELSAQALAQLIKALPDYDPKKPVRLYPCDSGDGPNSPAAQLSRELPNKVIASNKDTGGKSVRSERTGKIVKSEKPHPLDGGKWNTFQNGKELKDNREQPVKNTLQSGR
jgi:RHS repeat-associated protein